MRIKQFIKTALVFLTGNVMSKIISILLLPIYTGKIIPSQFGNYDIAFSFINLIAPIAFFQIWDGMYRLSFDFKSNTDKQYVVNNSIAFSLLGTVPYLALMTAVNAFSKLEYFPLVLVYGLFYAFNYVYTYSARVFLKNRLFVFSGIAATLSTAISNIILITVFSWDIKSIYVSAILGLIIQQLIIETNIGVLRNFKFKDIDRHLIVGMLKFSVPLCAATVSFWLLGGFTKLIIQQKVGNYGNGIYAVANKFGGFITLIVSVVQFAWNESVYLMSSDDKAEQKRCYNISVNVMTNSVIAGLSVFVMVSKIIFPFFANRQYNAALNLIPVAITGVAANGLASFLATMFMAKKRNSYIMFTTFFAALINIISGYLLTDAFKLYGAVSALTASFVILTLIRMIIISSLFEIKYNLKFLITNIIILIVSVSGFYLSRGITFDIVLVLTVIAAYCLLFGKQVLNYLLKLKNSKTLK